MSARDLVCLTVCPNEPVAAMLCAMLDAQGIPAMQRITDLAFGGGGELPSSGMGPREVLVRQEDLAAARELLDSSA